MKPSSYIVTCHSTFVIRPPPSYLISNHPITRLAAERRSRAALDDVEIVAQPLADFRLGCDRRTCALLAERKQQQRRLRPSNTRCFRHIRLAAIVGDRVEAAEIEQQVEGPVNPDLGKPGHIADQQLCSRRLALRRAYRARDVVDPGHVPAVLEHVLAVGPGATAEGDGPAWLERLGSLDQLDELRRWDARVPRLDSGQVSQLKEQSPRLHGDPSLSRGVAGPI